MSELEQVLGESPVPETEPVVEATPEQEVEAQVETPAEPETAQDAEKPEHSVPLPVFMELKNEMRAMKAQMQQAQAPQAPPPPDFVDPEGANYLQSQVQSAVQNATLNMSEAFARQTHGDAKVDAAMAALEASNNPVYHQQIMASPMPYDALVKWHASQEIAREIGSDPTAYRQKVEAEVRQKIEAEIAAKQAKEMAAKAAPSMANISGTGGGAKTTWTGPASLEAILGD